MKRKSAAYEQGLSRMAETVMLEVGTETTQKLPLIVDSIEEVIGQAALEKIEEIFSPVMATMMEKMDGASVEVGRILLENMGHLANKTR